MALSIHSVLFKKDGLVKEITLENMTKEFYNAHKENIYCPNESCEAKVEYASGTKRKYFRTKPYKTDGGNIEEQHSEDCPYSVEHKSGSRTKWEYSEGILVGISEKHITDALKRAYRKYKDPNYGKPRKSKNKEKSKSTIKRGNSESSSRGKVSLTASIDESQAQKKTKEAYLRQKNINEIGDKDYGEVRVVSGIMETFVIGENYKYVQLKMDDGRKGRVFFGEYYKANNEAQYQQLEAYHRYFLKKDTEDVFVVCTGDVTKDDFDVSIVISNYKSIAIDNNSHYEILKSLQRDL